MVMRNGNSAKTLETHFVNNEGFSVRFLQGASHAVVLFCLMDMFLGFTAITGGLQDSEQTRCLREDQRSYHAVRAAGKRAPRLRAALSGQAVVALHLLS